MIAPDGLSELPSLRDIGNLPRRSRLFSLAPMQVGQPMQESLISFLVRTSRAHAVNPRRLVMEVLAEADPGIGKLSYAGFFRNFSRTVNGLGLYAERFATALEKLTCVEGLRRLTMLPWQELFPLNGQGMLAAHPQWCPACLLQQHLKGEEPYLPLAWALGAFKVCSIHRCRLAQRCPHCQKHQPFIPRFPDFSICNECWRPLVSTDTLASVTHPQGEAPKDSEYWIAEAVGRMIAHHSTSACVPAIGDFRRFVVAQVDRLAAGNRAAFCREIGFPGRALNGWLTKGERPSIALLMGFCYGVGVQPPEIASNETRSYVKASSRFSGKLKQRAPARRLSDAQKEEALARLNENLASDDCLPLSRIAVYIGLSPQCLRYWFPEVCFELSARYRAALKQKSRIHQAGQCQHVVKIVRQLQDAGEYPSRRKVNSLLRKERMSLAQRHLVNAYRKARQI